MNAHHPELGSNKTNRAGSQIVNLIKDVPQIKILSPAEPTHIRGGRLDYSMTNITGHSIKSFMEDCLLSDHFALVTEIKVERPSPPIPQEHWDFKKPIGNYFRKSIEKPY